MAKLRDAAAAYEGGGRTRNISELDDVSVDVEIEEFSGTNSDGEDFSYLYFEQDGERFRVPNSVLDQLKDQLEENPKMKTFKVKKSGEGMSTKYTVIPKK